MNGLSTEAMSNLDAVIAWYKHPRIYLAVNLYFFKQSRIQNFKNAIYIVKSFLPLFVSFKLIN